MIYMQRTQTCAVFIFSFLLSHKHPHTHIFTSKSVSDTLIAHCGELAAVGACQRFIPLINRA